MLKLIIVTRLNLGTSPDEFTDVLGLKKSPVISVDGEITIFHGSTLAIHNSLGGWDEERTGLNIISKISELEMEQSNDIVILYHGGHGAFNNLQGYISTNLLGFNSLTIKQYSSTDGQYDILMNQLKEKVNTNGNK